MTRMCCVSMSVGGERVGAASGAAPASGLSRRAPGPVGLYRRGITHT